MYRIQQRSTKLLHTKRNLTKQLPVCGCVIVIAINNTSCTTALVNITSHHICGGFQLSLILYIRKFSIGQEHIGYNTIVVAQHKETHLLMLAQPVTAHKSSHIIRNFYLKRFHRIPSWRKHLLAEVVHLQWHFAFLAHRHVLLYVYTIEHAILTTRRIYDNSGIHNIATKHLLHTV